MKQEILFILLKDFVDWEGAYIAPYLNYGCGPDIESKYVVKGAVDELDVDRDFPRINGVKEGLYQYYEIEKTTDLWSLNSGRVQEKVGVNQCPLPTKRSMVSFVLLENNHLTLHGIEYFVQHSKNFVLVTSNSEHPAFSINADNLHILYYP
ncbi:MAG: hypothetical protein ACLU7O_21990 [Bacteroides thetaiotaomicron]